VLGKEEAQKQRDYIQHLLNQRNIEFSNDLPPEEIWKPLERHLCTILHQQELAQITFVRLYYMEKHLKLCTFPRA
jgi:hypothetical protein